MLAYMYSYHDHWLCEYKKEFVFLALSFGKNSELMHNEMATYFYTACISAEVKWIIKEMMFPALTLLKHCCINTDVYL